MSAKDHLASVYKFHAEAFGTAEQQEIVKKLAQEKARADAELAYRYANLCMPDDIRSRAKSWGMEAFCEVLWTSAFQAGFREANRTSQTALAALKGAAHD
jgi:hypothetical protein